VFGLYLFFRILCPLDEALFTRNVPESLVSRTFTVFESYILFEFKQLKLGVLHYMI